MATRIGKKPLTNAERQRRFRQKKNAAGLTRREIWTGFDGFLAPPSKNGGYATMTLKQFDQKLSKLLLDFEEGDREMVYAEVFEYAKKVIPKFMKISEDLRKILQDALKK